MTIKTDVDFAENDIFETEAETSFIMSADLDNDGDLDILEKQSSSGSDFIVYINEGDLEFTEEVLFTTTGSHGQFLIIDIDNDGYLDIVDYNDTHIKTYLNDGDIGFSLNETLAWADRNYPRLAAGDLDQDGDVDIVSSGVIDGAVFSNEIYLNNGSGDFTIYDTNVFEWEAKETKGIEIADFNGDGKNDIAIGGDDDDGYVYINQGDMEFEQIVLASDIIELGLGMNYWNIEAVDVDNDGDLDLRIASAFYLNDGTGIFYGYAYDFVITAEAEYYGASRWKSSGDFDNDGDLDFILSDDDDNASSTYHLMLNDGMLGFYENDQEFGIYEDDNGVVIYQVPHEHGVAVGDFDNDGDLDVVLGFEGSANLLYENELVDDGGGFVQNTTSFESDEIPLIVFDANNDGYQDYYITKLEGTAPEVWINDGSGDFVKSALEASLGYPIISDFDNDGDFDLLDPNTFGVTKLYVNDGEGTYALVENAFGTDTGNLKANTADFNNDGYIDVLFSVWTGIDRLFLNDGDGTFTLVSGLFDTITDGYDSDVGDVDSDGDYDIIIGNNNMSK